MKHQAAGSDKRTAVLLIAHGSRRQSANDELVRLTETMRKQSQYEIVEYAYLEIAEPTIPQGLQSCLRLQPIRVLMMPYFLSAGAHVTNDLERFRREFVREHPTVEGILCQPIGSHPKIVEIVIDRLRECCSDKPYETEK